MISDDKLLQSAQTTGNGSVYDLGARSLTITFYLTGNGTTSGGEITYETSDDPTYTGTWALLATAVNASDVSGNKKKITTVTGCFRIVRARISSNITGGGNIDVRVVAAQ